MKTQEKKIGIGVNILVIKDEKVLLGLRKSVIGDGTWGFPGGKLEFKELLADTAKRELLEETNLFADELEFIGISNQSRGAEDQHWIQINFYAKTWHGEVKLMEPEKCSSWEWFDMNKLPEPMFMPHKNMVKDYLDKNFFREEN